ncbi:hypothetical protein CERZMDRAFT_53352 [Cercospora zeae-maydis SCOH1-5]|uniref:Tat pathway signal sequence protein n=1 Tax=Cercospora zeae-maydis SCOH1-5 TaxID=717836 RepID=A0A6A6EYR5_9PEZI|nr:hypothetical protein CERZMDRAFT_53352 [Cercospora zeae-maydis SCOH1-5]
MLDDEGDTRFPENEKYKGQPRPELDEAWSSLLNGFNIRVPHHMAVQTGFESIELSDGSRDLWATPTVLHNLHCLKKIREAIWADHYQVLPLRESNGTILAHTDHCIDNLRQSIMCNADLTLYHYYWQNESVRPMPSVMSPHVCMDWTKLQNWLNKRKFSIYEEGLLVHPKYGPMDGAKWPT